MKEVMRALMVLAVVGCASCDQQPARQMASTVTPLTAPSLQPPMQGSDINPKVSYDPCTMISDAIISKAGYDPATRKRYAGVVKPPTIIFGCEFYSQRHISINPTSRLEIASSNENLDADRKYWTDPPTRQQPVRAVTAGNRVGFEVTNFPGNDCYIYLPTKAGGL